jgi:O-antigen/teichoic acid export membrane protein
MLRLTPDTIFDSDRLSYNLARKSVRGGMVTMTAQGVQFVLSLAGTIVLARLLTPDDYGLIGMVTVVVGFAEMFKDAGLSMATVQNERISHEQISTLFWLNVLISAFLGLCVLTGSPMVALFYGKPELTAITAVLSLSFIISGLTIQHQALLRRNMQFGMLASIQIASRVISLISMITLACFGWKYWALVGGTLANALSGTLLTLFFCPWIPGRMKRGTGVRDMVKFGGHVTGANIVNYISMNLDSIMIGKFINAAALGLYSKAYQLFMMPISQIRDPMTQVAMPVLSSLKSQPDRYTKYYLRILDILASLTIPLALYCVIEANFLIRLILGSQWIGAVPVFQALAIAGLIQPVSGTLGLVMLSFGFSDRYFYWGVFNNLVFVPAFVIGLQFGIEGVAVAYAVASYIKLVPSLFYCFHKTPITVSLFMRTLVWPFFISVFSGGTVILIKNISTADSITSHFISLALFAGIYMGGSYCRKQVREMISLFRESLLVFPK